MNSNFDIQEVIMTDILAQSTEHKPETVTETIINELLPETKSPTPETVEQKEEPETDPENSADAIIDMINMVNKVVFLPAGAYKAKKKIPKDVFQIMEQAELKEYRGEELTDKDKKALKGYAIFNKKMEKLRVETPFTKEEIEELKPATIAMVKKFGWEVSEGVWFGVKLFELMSKRAINIFMD